MKPKHIVASITAVALAVGLTPLPAFAGEGALSAGEVAAPAKTQAVLQTQASGKKTVYVLSKVTDTRLGTYPLVYKYKYTKTGLLAKAKKGNLADHFSYKNTRLTRQAAISFDDRYTLKAVTLFEFNENGQRAKAFWDPIGEFPMHSVDTYGYASGRVATINYEYAGSSQGNEFSGQSKYKLSYNKKGLVSKAVRVFPEGKSVDRFSYDKKGNLVKVVNNSEKTFKNAYKNNRLAKRVDSDTTYTYTYKAVKVPAKYVSTIKAQQWALLNGNLNLVFARQAYCNHSRSLAGSYGVVL